MEFVSSCLQPSSVVQCLSIGAEDFLVRLGARWKELQDIAKAVFLQASKLKTPLEKARDTQPLLGLLTDLELCRLLGSWGTLIKEYKPLSTNAAFTEETEPGVFKPDITLLEKESLKYLHSWVRTLFPDVQRLQFTWNGRARQWEVTGFTDRFAEVIQFNRTLPWCHSAARWLLNFQETVVHSLIRGTLHALEERGASNLDPFDQTTPSLCLQLATRIRGWQEMEERLVGQCAERTALEEIRQTFINRKDTIQETLKSARESASSRMSCCKLWALCGISLELIYAIESLLKDPVPSCRSFIWLRMIKHIAKHSEHDEKYNGSDLTSVVVRQFHVEHLYGWDYLNGLQPYDSVIVPPLADSEELVQLALALSNFQPALLTGLSGTGRRTTTRVWSRLLGRRLVEHSAWALTERFDKVTSNDEVNLQRFLQQEVLKCVRSGSLLALYDVQAFPVNTIPFLSNLMSKIGDALKEDSGSKVSSVWWNEALYPINETRKYVTLCESLVT
ncbi:unnamed protein product [Dicrocoelium dendriticum]|nr:unnamed protein product [Dicrocoelium dendriticum]